MIQRRAALFLVVLAMVTYWPEQAAAQAAAPPQKGDIVDDPDLDLVPLQPDFTVISMPTALRLPRYKSAFRVTQRRFWRSGPGLLRARFGRADRP
jgi:hypothetical protein